jgi:SAM-dependent methyltransferase
VPDSVKELFDEKAAGWALKYAPGGPLAARREAITRAVCSSVPRSARILDFGCGTGDVAIQLHALGYSLTGCDISPRMLEVARSRDVAIAWHQLAPDGLRPFADESFDAIVASSVLEYVEDIDGLLREFHRMTRPGGALVVTVPNPRHPLRRLEGLLRPATLLGDLGWLKINRRLHRYARYLRESRNRFELAGWEALLAKSGFVFRPSESETQQPLSLLVCRRL